jgi:hypothetical protein
MEESMGNLRERSFEAIWHGAKAQRIRWHVKDCPRNCWMIGSAAEPMKTHLTEPLKWIIARKFLRRPAVEQPKVVEG